MVRSQTKTEYRGCAPCAAPSIEPQAASYTGSGKTLLDKDFFAENAEYIMGDTVFAVHRVFQGQRTRSRLIKELIEDRAESWYNETGKIAAASQNKEGS